jgi:hypothetical protein
VLTARLDARIRRDFPSVEAEPVRAVLEELVQSTIPGSDAASVERILAAVLLLARGDSRRLLDAVALAQQGWRDVLVAAGLAHDDWPDILAEAPTVQDCRRFLKTDPLGVSEN